jgi:hypothetical protein
VPSSIRRLCAAGGLTLALAACGSQAGAPAPPKRVSVRAAIADPCLLVSRAQAQAALGRKVRRQLSDGDCAYQPASGPPLVLLSVQKAAPQKDSISISLIAGIEISSPARAAGVGHGAECGPAKLSPGTAILLASIGTTGDLEIFGPSCAADARIARLAYRSL